MIQSTTGSCGPCTTTGIPIQSLRFISSADNKYIGLYAQNQCKEWVPLNVGLTSMPSLQQVRDVDRNISMNTGSYTDAHFYLRSAEGNNVTTAFYTDKDGGGIQSGNSTGAYVSLNLQPLGGLLNYGGSEVATKAWTTAQGYLKTETDPVYTAAVPNILMVKTTIPTGANLNNYQTTGIYLQPANANAAAGTNYPAPYAGKLEVVYSSATMMWQTYHVYGDGTAANRAIWRREYYSGTWTPWVKLIDTTSAAAYELLANKATSFATVNNTLYPTTQAVNNLSYNNNQTSKIALSNAPDITKFDTSPIVSNGMSDILAFRIPIVSETSTDWGATWSTVANTTYTGINSQRTKYTASTGQIMLINTNGSINSVRLTYSGINNMYPSWVKYVSGYTATSVNFILTLESSSDNATYTVVGTYSTLSQSIGGCWLKIQNVLPNNNNYLRITITADATGTAAALHLLSQIQLLTYRQDYQYGVEANYPFTWSNERYLTVTSPTTTVTTGYDMALLNASGQITRGSFANMLSTTAIQNQTAAVQTGNYRISGYGQVDQLGIGGAAGAGIGVRYARALTGDVNPCAFYINSTIQSDATGVVLGYSTFIGTAAVTFTTANLYHFIARQGTIGAGSAITSQVGFYAQNTLAGAAANYGFRGDLSANGSSNYNLFMAGTAWNYIAGRVGLNSQALSNIGLRNSLPVTGSVNSYAHYTDPIIQSDVTTTAYIYSSVPAVTAASFTLASLAHFYASQGTIGAGSTVTNQYGFLINSSIVGATNNYGIVSQIPTGTNNNWNLYMSGSAPNYMAGRLGLNTTNLSSVALNNALPITGSTLSYGYFTNAVIQSDVTTAQVFTSAVSTQATTFTLGTLSHFVAQQNTIGTGSSITTQQGFLASANLTGASINYGFRGLISSGIGRWNLYMDGTAANYMAGTLTLGTLAGSGTTLVTADNTGLLGHSTISTLFDGVYIKQGGNTFGTAMTIGTNDNFSIFFRTNNTNVANLSTAGNLSLSSVSNFVNSSNSLVTLGTSGTTISRNIADAASTLTVNNINASFTGALATFQNVSTTVALIDRFGNGRFPKMGIGSPIFLPTYLLDVNAGTLASATPLASFSQNGGSLQILNGTAGASIFYPYIKGSSTGGNTVGLGFIAQGSDSYTVSAIHLSARNATGMSTVTSGKILSVQNYTTEYLAIDYLGATAITNSLVVGSNITTVTPFHASATAFASLVPMMGIATGTTAGTYQEGIVIRHGGIDTPAVLRETGLFIKLSSEGSAGESQKGGAITMKSLNTFANSPDMNFYILSDANPKMTIFNNGTIGMANLAGTGTRIVVADSTGKLSTQTIAIDSNFANTDLTATSNRLHMFGANSLGIAGTGWSIGGASSGMFLQSTTGNGLLIGASNSNSNVAQLKTDLLTTNRIYQLPNTAGTLALTSDVLNIYNTDGTLTSNRTVAAAGKDLTFSGFGTFKTYYDSTSYFSHNASGFTINKDNPQGSNYMTFANGGMVIQSASSAGYGSYQLLGNGFNTYIQGSGTNSGSFNVTSTTLAFTVSQMGLITMTNVGVVIKDNVPSGGSLALSSPTAVTINSAGSYPVSFNTTALSALRLISFQDKSGTVALTSDISALNLQSVASAGNSYLGDLLLGISGNQVSVGSGTVGSGNTRLGAATLASATAGDWNTAIGSAALGAMVASDNNTAVGEGALFAYKGISSSGSNSAFGDTAGANMTEGNDNLFLGMAAGSVGGTPMPGGDLNIFIGRSAGNFWGVSPSATIGSRNIYLGFNAGYGPTYATASDKLLIGNNPSPGTSVHIIEGSMVQGAQSLKFNATVAIASLAGTGNRMVVADTTGNLSTQSIPTGTVTNITAGSLSPLFTTSVATGTTTPALSFALSAAAANTFFGNNTAASASPAYTSMAALTAANDTNVTISLGGTPATSLFKAVSLTMGWTGTLSVTRGGTGAASLTGVLVGNVTSAVTAVTGTANQLMRRNAANTAYEFFTPTYLTSNQTITLSGDIVGSGATAITTAISVVDNRLLHPSDVAGSGVRRVQFGFGTYGNDNSGNYSDFIHFNSYTDGTGGNQNVLMLAKGFIGMRVYQGGYQSTGVYSLYKDVAFQQDIATQYIKNQYAAAQSSTNLWISGNAKATQFIGNNNNFGISDQSGYWGFYGNDTYSTTAVGKFGGVVISNTYSDVAPGNGLFVKGASYLVGGAYTNTLASYTGTDISVMSAGQTFTVNAALYGIGNIYSNNFYAYNGSTIGLGTTGTSIQIASLAGTGDRMVMADAAGNLSSQALQWQITNGFNYLGPSGSSSGIDTQGGYASRYYEMTASGVAIPANVEFISRWNDSNTPWTLQMPNPALFECRVMTIRNCALQPNSYLTLAGYPPVFTSDGSTLTTLASVKYTAGTPSWIRVISQRNTSTGNYEWRVCEFGYPVN